MFETLDSTVFASAETVYGPADGVLPTQVAARQLLRVGRDEPRAFDLLRDAWKVHQSAPSIASPHEYIRIDQTSEEFARAAESERYPLTPGCVVTCPSRARARVGVRWRARSPRRSARARCHRAERTA